MRIEGDERGGNLGLRGSQGEQLFLVSRVLHKATEEAIRVLQQVGRRIEFDFLARVKNENAIVFYDCVLCLRRTAIEISLTSERELKESYKSVRNGQDGNIF